MSCTICSICLEEMHNLYYISVCGHKLHTICFSQCIDHKLSKCPVCRKPFVISQHILLPKNPIVMNTKFTILSD